MITIDPVTSKDLKRQLKALGASFQPAKGSHLKVFLNGRQSVIPMHKNDLPKGTLQNIYKQLGIK